MGDRPNIFKYATKELSQDAMICWFLACLESKDEFYKAIGMEFAEFILKNKGTKAENICLYDNTIWPQFRKMDVFSVLCVGDKVIPLIFEDKTDTYLHSEQMKRYCIIKMISNNSDDFKAAIAIAKNVNRAKEDIILRLFETLENKLKSVNFQYEQIHGKLDYKYNDYEAIKKYYTKVKTYPAINFKYKKVDDKRDIWFRVEVDWRLFCGFVVVENNEQPETPIMKFEELKQYINISQDLQNSDWWYYWEYLLDDKEELSPNFVVANDTLIKLFDEKYFDNFTNECVARIVALTKEMEK